jgi:hypothetical protein
MSKARRDGLQILMLGALVFLSLGLVLERSNPHAMEDFGVVYFPARTLLHHADPYNQADVLREYEAEGGDSLWKSPLDQGIITHYQYPPPSFCITAPFALMPWNVAQFLWAGLAAGGMILAAFLLWSLCADYAPVTAGVLIGFLLANSQVLLVLGNAAGPAVSLCIIAVWSFLRGKYPLLGVLCLAGSLMLKPHDSVLVWLFFLLAGSVYRKRALQVLGLIAVSAAPIVLYLFRLSSSWMRELRFNIAGLSVHGGPADPGPASAVSHGLGMMVNLQAAISTFWDDPRVYNPVAYLVCGLLLAALAVLVLRSRISTQSAWLAIASVSALSLLPIYHHLYDAKLILLSVPACVMLQAQGKRLGRLAPWVTGIAFVFTGDLAWSFLIGFIGALGGTATWLGGKFIYAAQTVPAPFAILLLGVFYLYAFARQVREERMAQ